MPKFINPSNLPKPFFDAAANDDYTSGDADYTPSSLIKPPYMAALVRDHDHEIEIDVANRAFIVLGKSIHGLLEKEEKDRNISSIVELRVYTQVGKWNIGMQFDRLERDHDKGIVTLQDWKVTSVYKFKKDWNGNYPEVPDWETQLNIGAFIIRKGGYYYDKDDNKREFKPLQVDKLEIVALLRDYRKADARREKGYPQTELVARQLKIWSDDDVVAYIHKRATAHDDAKTQNLSIIPPCTMEEMWAKDTTFAVMKIGGKRAAKAGFETEDSATAHIDKTATMNFDTHMVESRPGVRNRCQSYCDVAQFCPEYQKWLKVNDPEALQAQRKAIEKFNSKLKPKTEKENEK